MVTTTEASNRQAHSFVKGPRLNLDGVFYAIRVPERHPAQLHFRRVPYSPFIRYPCCSPAEPPQWAACPHEVPCIARDANGRRASILRTRIAPPRPASTTYNLSSSLP